MSSPHRRDISKLKSARGVTSTCDSRQNFKSALEAPWCHDEHQTAELVAPSSESAAKRQHYGQLPSPQKNGRPFTNVSETSNDETFRPADWIRYMPIKNYSCHVTMQSTYRVFDVADDVIAEALAQPYFRLCRAATGSRLLIAMTSLPSSLSEDDCCGPSAALVWLATTARCRCRLCWRTCRCL